jgi:probable rRNA maturation factor
MNETEPSEPPSQPSGAEDDTPGRERTGGPTLDLIDRAGLLDAGVRTRLFEQTRAALAHTGAPGEVRVEVVDDDAMTRAHLEYLDIDGTTDVLTFDLTGGGSAPAPDGAGEPLDVDIMICLDEARRNAAELGHPVEHEMTLYILHGVLHCLGHDDTDEVSFARMHAEEDRLLEAAGLGAVFARPSDGAGHGGDA